MKYYKYVVKMLAVLANLANLILWHILNVHYEDRLPDLYGHVHSVVHLDTMEGADAMLRFFIEPYMIFLTDAYRKLTF